jgi:hypothetical protein
VDKNLSGDGRCSCERTVLYFTYDRLQSHISEVVMYWICSCYTTNVNKLNSSGHYDTTIFNSLTPRDLERRRALNHLKIKIPVKNLG